MKRKSCRFNIISLRYRCRVTIRRLYICRFILHRPIWIALISGTLFLAIENQWNVRTLVSQETDNLLEKYQFKVIDFWCNGTNYAAVQFYTYRCPKELFELLNKHGKWNKVNWMITTICKLGAKQGFWKKLKMTKIWKKENGEGI